MATMKDARAGRYQPQAVFRGRTKIWTRPGKTVTPPPAGETGVAQGGTSVGRPVAWHPSDQAGGGWVTGMVRAADGCLWGRTDVGGAYRLAGDTWRQALPAEAAECLAFEQSTSNALHLMAATGAGAGGQLWRSTDRGESWAPVSDPLHINGNGPDRVTGSRLAYFAGAFWFASQKDGLRRVPDGQSMHYPVPVPGLAAGADTGAAAAGNGALYVGVYGAGVYRSTDGAEFELVIPAAAGERVVSILPTTSGVFAQILDKDWTRYLVKRDTTGQVKTLAGGWWAAEAFDTTADGQWIAVIGNGNQGSQVWHSADGGDTWTRTWCTFVGLDESWARIIPGENWLSPGDLVLDRYDRTRAWFGEGSGVWRVDGIGTENVTYTWHSGGLKDLVCNQVVPTSAGMVHVCWDRPLFLEKVSGEVGQVMSSRFSSAWAAGTGADDDSLVFAVVDDRRESDGIATQPDGLGRQSGISRDGGLTWSLLPSISAGTHPSELRYGTVAVGWGATPVLLWEATGNEGLYRSPDMGATWTKVADATGHTRYTINRHTLVADRNVQGTVWHYRTDGLWKSVDSGATWTKVQATAGAPDGWATVWHARLLSVPGKSGWLALSAGHLDGQPPTHWVTEDGGVTWRKLTGMVGHYLAAFQAGTDGYLLQVNDSTGAVTLSKDLGRTWQPTGDVVPAQPSRVTSLAVKRRDGGLWLAVSRKGNTVQRVNVTADLPAPATPAPPDPPLVEPIPLQAVDFTMTPPTSGSTVWSARAVIKARPAEELQFAVFSVRDKTGGKYDFARSGPVTATPEGYVLTGTKSFPPGEYTVTVAVKKDGVWKNITPTQTFTVPA